MDRKKNDIEVVKIKNQIEKYKIVKQILSQMHPDGYWLHKKSNSDVYLGNGLEYVDYETTHFCLALIDYFLKREALFRCNKTDKPVIQEITKTIFPITWRAGLIEVIYALIKMGYGNVVELNCAWSMLESKRDYQGKFLLDWTPPKAQLKQEKRNEPNKWITFYPLISLKYRFNKNK